MTFPIYNAIQSGFRRGDSRAMSLTRQCSQLRTLDGSHKTWITRPTAPTLRRDTLRPRFQSKSTSTASVVHYYRTFASANSVFSKDAKSPSRSKASVGLVGARGHIGRALCTLLDSHPNIELTHISSRELAGSTVADYTKSAIMYENLSPEDVRNLEASGAVDCWVLALPNGLSDPYVAAIDAASSRTNAKTVIVDLSADHRFDNSWTYGLPELTGRADIARATRISNPGCFATAAQLALAPILKFTSDRPTVFGVSGYSGAGTKPSPTNDLDLLRDNILPYGVVDHVHEQEISTKLGRHVSLIPHVSSWFQGILLSISVSLNTPMTTAQVGQVYREYYPDEKLISIIDDTPLVRQISGTHGVEIGGFTVDHSGKRLVLFATIDNLNKGGATQCLRESSTNDFPSFSES
ncbi:Protein arg-6 [Fusarium oxysporum]|uniref:Protein arg-6 n=1 Tax=Fusarium oxysporum TaxID=5507 RepID=A0A420MHD5_FUSOX|nr:Protein arg-6 [Fusarium oxysporum]